MGNYSSGLAVDIEDFESHSVSVTETLNQLAPRVADERFQSQIFSLSPQSNLDIKRMRKRTSPLSYHSSAAWQHLQIPQCYLWLKRSFTGLQGPQCSPPHYPLVPVRHTPSPHSSLGLSQLSCVLPCPLTSPLTPSPVPTDPRAAADRAPGPKGWGRTDEEPAQQRDSTADE